MSPRLLAQAFALAIGAAVPSIAQNLPGNSNPNGFATQVLGPYALFAANDQTSGMELWRMSYPGPTASLVRDIRPGSSGSDPREIVPLLSNYLFAADDGVHGAELWRTDGTTSGTTMVADIRATGSSFPRALTTVGGLVFFVADDGTNGEELWQSDGTTTTLTKDIWPGGDSAPRSLFAFGNVLLFTADDGVDGRELWQSDGTLSGTQRILDIRPGSAGSGPRDLAQLNGKVLFVADDGIHGAEPWITDGTMGGTMLLRDIEPGSTGSQPAGLREHVRVFFAASTTAEGRELWMSDGTTAGTTLVADLQPGAVGSEPSDLAFGLLEVWFVADDGLAGREVWRTDVGGTSPIRITDLVAGAGSALPTNLQPTGHPGELLFTDGSQSGQLWVTSAAPAGATSIATFRNGPGTLIRNANIGGTFSASLVVFTAADASQGLELWRTDGSASGTTMVANIAPDGTGMQPAELDLHTDPIGTLLTICLEDGPPLGIGLIALAAAPSPGITLPGIIDGQILITAPLVTNLVLLDGSGMGCITITVPGTFFSIEFVAQGFTADPITFFPLTATDIGSAGVTSAALVTLFGGTVKTVGTFVDKDHRYEVSVQLPPGVHTPGTFKFRHRIGEGSDSYLKELGEEHHYPYNGETLPPQPFMGSTPTEKISGLELWFVDGEGRETFVWKSYC